LPAVLAVTLLAALTPVVTGVSTAAAAGSNYQVFTAGAGETEVLDPSGSYLTAVDGGGTSTTPNDIAVTSGNSTVFLADGTSVEEVDAATDTVTKTFATGSPVVGVAVNSSGSTVYATHGADDSYSVITTSSGAVSPVSLAFPAYGVAVSGSLLFVVSVAPVQGASPAVQVVELGAGSSSPNCSNVQSLSSTDIADLEQVEATGSYVFADDPADNPAEDEVTAFGDTCTTPGYSFPQGVGSGELVPTGNAMFGDGFTISGTDVYAVDGQGRDLYEDTLAYLEGGSGTSVHIALPSTLDGESLGTSDADNPAVAVSPDGTTAWVSENTAEGQSGVFTVDLTDPSADTVGGPFGLGSGASGIVTTVASSLPTVTRVSPAAGVAAGGTTITITGTNLSSVTTVSLKPRGGGTPIAASISTQSATSITAVTGDATTEIAAPATSLTTDVVVTNPAGSSAKNSADVFTYGCEQDPSVTDGDWDVDGCLYQPDATDDDTNQPSSLDGLVVTPTDGGTVDYSTSADDATSTAPTQVALNLTALSGTTNHVSISDSPLDLSLGGSPVHLTLPSGFQLLGLPLSGSLTLTPGSDGTATGTASGTLPSVLGGGSAQVSLVTTLTGGVTSLTATASTGNLAQLFGLDAITLSYSAGTWKVSAEATTPAGGKEALSGSLVYAADGTLTSGSLEIKNISLAGLVTIKVFSLSYTAAKGWSGSASLTQAKEAASVSLTFNTSGQLTSGSLNASGVTLFQVFQLTFFDLSYTAATGTWKLSIEIAHQKTGATASANFSESNGVIQGVDLDVTKIPLLAKITLNDLHLTYALANGHETYSATVDADLPGTVVKGIEAELTFTDGNFTHGKLVLKGNVPLFEVVFLHTLGVQIDISPKEQVIGQVGLSAGPQIDGGELLGLDGSLGYEFPTTATGTGIYTLKGDLTALKVVLGEAKITVDGSTAAIELTLGKGDKGFSAGSYATIRGQITGHLVRHSFTAQGKVELTVKFDGTTHEASGTVTVSNRGIVACGEFPALSKGPSGFAEEWGHAPVVKRGDCAPANF
jgi:hypothetical protein